VKELFKVQVFEMLIAMEEALVQSSFDCIRSRIPMREI